MKDDYKTKKQLINELTELRSQNAALAKSESAEKYRRLVEDIKDVIYELDSQGVVLYISPAIRDMLGFDSDEIVGKNFTGLAHKDDLSRLEEWFSELRKGSEYSSEYRVRNKSGNLKWARTNTRPVMEYGQFKGARGILIDVTAQKQAEEALREANETLSTIVKSSPLAIIALDVDGNVIRWNPAAEEMFGWVESEALGHPLPYVSEDKRDEHLKLRERVLRGESFTNVEANRRKKDGSSIDISISTAPLRDSQGRVTGIMSVNANITERKRAEEALNEKDQFMESMIQSSAVATFVVNTEHKVLYWNRACEDLTGMKSDDLLGTRDHWKAFYDHPRQCVADIIIDNKFNVMNNLYEIHTKSLLIPDGIRAEGWYLNLGGKNRYVIFDAAPIRDNNGKLIAAIETLLDITERKQAEEQLHDTLESLRKAVGATIQVMVSAVEARDPYTAGHQARSANLARCIATVMGLPQEKIEGLRMAGSIHDIGKLSIPAEILSKPTRLTNLEFSLIKEHARAGYEMLKEVESPWPLAEIVHQHHERMDGSGYPGNLKGDEILMEARILAVADVVESMASHRPYRPAIGIEAALEEIEKNKGILYDDAVADACLRLFREKGFRLD
jgi:PAS domain S-box-containing protein